MSRWARAGDANEARPLLSVSMPLLAMPQGSKTAVRRGKKIILLEGRGKRPAEFKAYRDMVATYMRVEARRHRTINWPLDDAAVVEIICSFPRPKHHHGADGAVKARYLTAPKRTKPDGDKLVRAIMDAGAGVLWSDDAIVVGHSLRKRYADHPSIEINVYAACWCGQPGPCADCVADAALPGGGK